MENTKYSFATWIPNQIEAYLKYMDDILQKYQSLSKQGSSLELYSIESDQHKIYVEILTNQIRELKKVDYDASLIYYFNKELKEDSTCTD